MEFKPDFNRLKKVLLRDGEPDRVPFCEIWIDTEVLEKCTGKGFSIEGFTEFYYSLGYDFVPGWIDFGYERREILTEDTAEMSRGQRSFIDDSKGIIETRKDFDAYNWPEVTDSVAYWINEQIKALPEGMKVIAVTPGGILENVMWLMGYAPFSYAIYDDEQLIYDMFERIGTNHIKMLETCLENSDVSKIGAVAMGDDMGFNHSTMFSPELMRKYVFPWQKKFVDAVHKYDLPMILHSCGNVNAIMDDLIDYVGIDAKHSFEDNILPVTGAKEKYGNRIALIGGVDVHFLCTANEAEIRNYVDKAIEVCAPGGGYALGTGSSFTNYMPIENWKAMLDQGRKKGMYPIGKPIS